MIIPCHGGTQSLSGLVLRTKQRVEQFNIILKRVQAVVERLLAELASVERVANGMWLTEAISCLDANQSCFESLVQFLSDSIVVVFEELLPVVDLNDNSRFSVMPAVEILIRSRAYLSCSIQPTTRFASLSGPLCALESGLTGLRVATFMSFS